MDRHERTSRARESDDPGRHRAGPPRPRAAASVLGLLAATSMVAVTGWLVLVAFAVREGRAARGADGAGTDGGSRWLLAGAVVGASACALLALLGLVALVRATGLVGDSRPQRARDG